MFLDLQPNCCAVCSMELREYQEELKDDSNLRNFDVAEIAIRYNLLWKLSFNRPFAAGGHMVQNPKYWRAKECDKTPLGNENKEKSHFSS